MTLQPPVATTVALETGDHPGSRPCSALGEGAHHVLVHSRDSLGSGARPLDIAARRRPHRPRGRRRHRRAQPDQRRAQLDRATPATSSISAEIRTATPAAALQSTVLAEPRASSTRRARPRLRQGLHAHRRRRRVRPPTRAGLRAHPALPGQGADAGRAHSVYVRGKDAAGNWGGLTASNALVRLIVDKTAPVLGAVTATPEPDERRGDADPHRAGHRDRGPTYVGPRFQGAEFWTGTTDPGAGKATRVQVTDRHGGVTAAIPLAGHPAGHRRSSTSGSRTRPATGATRPRSPSR